MRLVAVVNMSSKYQGCAPGRPVRPASRRSGVLRCSCGTMRLVGLSQARRVKGTSEGGGDSNPVWQTEGLRSCRLDDLPFPSYSRRNSATLKGLRSTTGKKE